MGGSEVERFRGSVRFGFLQSPVAKLLVSDDRVELRGFIARDTLRKDEGDHLVVDELSWPFGLRLIHGRHGTRGAVFWTPNGAEVVASLRNHGWQVDGT